jgi:hypothetical protein
MLHLDALEVITRFHHAHQVAVTSLVSGALVCVFTNMLVEESHGSSTPAEQKTIVLSAALSYDAGVTWPFVRDLQPRFEPG